MSMQEKGLESRKSTVIVIMSILFFGWGWGEMDWAEFSSNFKMAGPSPGGGA